MKRDESRFFKNTHWYHATPAIYLNSIMRGINCSVNKGKPLDFGYGFYLSPDKEWSIKYINLMISDIEGEVKEDQGIIIEYEFSPIDYIKKGATYKFFHKQDVEYAEFVINNRINAETYDFNYDFVAGLMLTENQILTVRNCKKGLITKEEAIQAILSDRYENDWQMLLHTQVICNELKPHKFYDMKGEEINVKSLCTQS